MAKLTKNEVIQAKIESTYRTDASPTADDSILVENLEPSIVDARIVERQPIESTHGPRKHLNGGYLWQISFDVEVKHSGTADTPPEVGPLIRGCGCAENIIASTSVDYQPSSDSPNHDSLTIYFHHDGDLIKITGARGNMSFNTDVGGRLMMSFTFKGHEDSRTTATASPNYDNTIPPIFKNASFTVGGYSAVISNLSFDMGRTIAVNPDASQPNGYGEIRLSDLNITGSIDPEAVAAATNDFLDDFKNATGMALDTGTIGSGVGNQVQLTMPNIAYRDFGFGDRNGVRTYDLPVGIYKNSGDDQFKFLFS